MRFSRCSKIGASSSLFRFPEPMSVEEANDSDLLKAQSQQATLGAQWEGLRTHNTGS